MDRKIMDYIADDWHLDRLTAEMPEEYMDYIVFLIDPPFEPVGGLDREMLIFIYILDRIRFMYYYGEEQDERYPELFYALESIFDYKPEYRTERFWNNNECNKV